MEKLKKYKKNIIIIIICIVLMIIAGLVFLKFNNDVLLMKSEQAGKRYSTKKEASTQIAAFFDQENGMDIGKIRGVRSKVYKGLYDEGIIDEKSDPNKRKWIDCFSTETDVQLKRAGNTYDVRAVLTGGDFFEFHPFKLMNGTYYSENEPNKFQILIDQNVAWNIFGTSEVSGLELMLDDKIYTVSGVVSADKTKAESIAYGNSNRVYIPYASYLVESSVNNIKTSSDSADSTDSGASDDSASTVEAPKITSYELIMPNPVKSYGLNAAKDALGVSADATDDATVTTLLNFDGVEVRDVSERFKFFGVLGRYREILYGQMKSNSIIYPFWENEARYVEVRALTTYVVMMALLLFPFICLVIFCFKILPGYIKIAVLKIISVPENIIEARRRKKYYGSIDIQK